MNRLETLFSTLHFQVQIYKNLRAREILQVINSYAFQTDHSNYDCFVCCILSHGENGGKLVSFEGSKFTLNEVTSPFRASVCPSLSAKPKVFLVQACRGEEYQTCGNFEADFNYEADFNCKEMNYSVPDFADFLIGYATVAGFRAHRHRLQGSVFIQTLCETIESFATRLDFLGIFTKVNEKISRMEFEGPPGTDWKTKQIPELKSTLTRRLFFT